MEIKLKIQLLFGSSIFFRSVPRVTNVPFAVPVNTALALRRLFCLMEIGLRSFHLSTIGALTVSQEKLPKFKEQGIYERWKEDRKWNNQLISQLGGISAFQWNGKETAQNGNWVMSNYKRWKGNQGGITVYSINLWTIVAGELSLVYKNQIQNSSL